MVEGQTQSYGTVLIVDDTPGNLAVLSDMLAEANYRVLVATDGISAIEQIALLKPDIILLDIKMPGIDGYETCRRLKQNPQTSNIPIIFMTGLSDLDDLLHGFQQGAVDYIVKPIRPAEVLARVSAQLFQYRTFLRAENALNRVAFAAFSFNDQAQITWQTQEADKALIFEQNGKQVNGNTEQARLPEAIHRQIFNNRQTPDALNNQQAQEIILNKEYHCRIFSCHKQGEYLALVQKNEAEWDSSTLKSEFGLTAREAEILMWISRGKTNKEAGLILETSPRTINKHLEHIFEKLQVSTRAAAVAKVLNK